jgi:NAD(P)-dependent dehydrogenase (short-subunit alcohol dehydrogenase family)
MATPDAGERPMRGKVVLVTGATSGIGAATVRELARQGAAVVAVARNPGRAAALVDRIQAETPGAAAETLLADLSAQADVRRLARQFKERHERLDVLINNAGAIFFRRQESADGVERTFALNHLAYFLLTNLLLDVLRASAPARVVNVASDAHRRGRVDFADLEGRTRYGGWSAYANSKLANLLFTYELARRLEGSGVTANAVHPGVVATGFGAGGWQGLLMRPFFRLFGLSPEEGARTVVYVATAPELAGVTGKYFIREMEAESIPASHDRAAAERLWRVSGLMTGLATA